MRVKQENSENREALPKFMLTLLGSLLLGGVIGFFIGLGRVFGLDASEAARRLDGALRAVTPWGVPVSSALTLGGCFALYRSAARAYAAWGGGDEDEAAEAIDWRLSWVLLLSSVQLVINLFFMAAIAGYMEDGALLQVGVFFLSCGCVVFAQQKTVDLERRMNPEKRGSVYDRRFHEKWLESCDELELRQIGQASYHAYMVTGRVCVGGWLALVILSMVFEISLLPVFVLLLVWGVTQVSYTLESIRLSKKKESPQNQPE